MKKNLLFFANCQGPAIIQALKHVDIFANNYDVKCYSNYLEDYENNIIEDAITNADVIIYQPLHNINHSTDNLLKLKKESAVTISFPYIYCNWLWLFYVVNKRGDIIFFDDNVIRDLKNKYNPTEIIELYKEGKIDFKIEERKQKSINILKDKEKNTDIKITDFILTNYKTKRLFNTPNHPTHHILINCSNQILKILNIDYIIPESLNIGEYNDFKYLPISDKIHTTYELTYKDDNDSFYLQMLTDILNDFQEKYHLNHPYRRAYFDYSNYTIYNYSTLN